MSVDQLVAEYQKDARVMREEVSRKGRQLAEARKLLRMALKYGCAASRPPDYLTEGCARDTAASIRATLPKLDDRSAKKRRARR